MDLEQDSLGLCPNCQALNASWGTETCPEETSKTPEGRSGTFRVQGFGLFLSFLFFFHFVDLNCCTISSHTSEKNMLFEPSRGVPPWREPLLPFFFFL